MTELDDSIPVEPWTPEDAERALKTNTRNYRPLKPSLVDKGGPDGVTVRTTLVMVLAERAPAPTVYDGPAEPLWDGR